MSLDFMSKNGSFDNFIKSIPIIMQILHIRTKISSYLIIVNNFDYFSHMCTFELTDSWHGYPQRDPHGNS